MPRLLPLGTCLSQGMTLSSRGLLEGQQPGAGLPPAASLLDWDPGSLALTSGEVRNPHQATSPSEQKFA